VGRFGVCQGCYVFDVVGSRRAKRRSGPKGRPQNKASAQEQKVTHRAKRHSSLTGPTLHQSPSL
ncbi:MAG: hypothetical protein NWR12_09640, partial [Haliea sp.]|nr:hypothetical protein [Haliea sp.]